MSPEERAEKIVLELQHFANDTHAHKKEYVAAEIREAVIEAGFGDCEKCKRAFGSICRACHEGEIRAAVEEALDRDDSAVFAGGKAEGYEEAAKIAGDHALIKGAHRHKGFDFCVTAVAEEIRARAKEVGE